MKITKSDLQQIIKEEAIRLYQIEKLQKAKQIVDENIRLISEGKKKEMSAKEMEELFGGLKNVASSIGSAIGQKVGQAKDYVTSKYAEGEKKAKIEKLSKEKTKIEAELQKFNEMLAKINSELKALTGTAKKAATPKAASAAKPAPKKATGRR